MELGGWVKKLADNKLVVFSGLDGAGKTTQIQGLMDEWRATGRSLVYLWTRGGYTPLFTLLKKILRMGRMVPPAGPSQARSQSISRPVVRKVWLTVSILDLILVYGLLVRWWLMTGKSVVCDRYLWDTLIDFQLNFPQEKVERWVLWRLLTWVTPVPDAAFLLLIPVEESLLRSQLKGEPFPDTPEVLSERLTAYRSQAEQGRWRVIDGLLPRDEVAASIQNTLGALR